MGYLGYAYRVHGVRAQLQPILQQFGKKKYQTNSVVLPLRTFTSKFKQNRSARLQSFALNHSPNNPVIELQGIVYQYPGQSLPAVDIDLLTVHAGEQIVLTGHSGCGKSTLLHLIAGLMDPTSGMISINGASIKVLRGSKRDRFRGQHIGMVFQTFQLLHGFTVIENVLAALMFSDLPRKEHRARASTLLETLGVNMPNARIGDLSVGQQQRVAVARAIACSPTIVLADEPTAALDPEFASIAMNLLQEACRSIGAALICVTHDTSLIERFDRHERLEDLSSARIVV